MTKPITPDEAESGKHIPDEVFEAFNELIAEGDGDVLQKDVVLRILAKIPDTTREQIFKKGWLNVEPAYRKAGWKVTYDKPGYCETYEANFTFRRKKRTKT
jgi:hypothetical protein